MRGGPERLTTEPARRDGTLYAGTSGFAYPDWAPRFYPSTLRARDLLPHYASRLPAVELNNTFYARPTPKKIAAWVAATPPSFRFVVKAQRGASLRAMGGGAGDAVPWLTESLPGFGERLGAVLFRIDARSARRDDRLGDDRLGDARLAGLLGAWPADIPLVLEAGHPSWHVDETFAALRAAGAVLCTTDSDDQSDVPDIRRTGPFLYLRLRRSDYDDAALDRWAARIAPFLHDGMDAYVLFRHDEDGTSALRAEGFAARVARFGPGA